MRFDSDPDDDLDKDARFFIRGLSITAIVVVLVLLATASFAHDWYPLACCSNRDCYELPEGLVYEGRGGYVVPSHTNWNGATVAESVQPYTSPPSPDGKFHICTNASGVILCFFAPGRGS